MSEQWYDEEIAPTLLDLSRKCQARGISFIAVVEYESGERGRTSFVTEDAGLAMRMIDFCARADTNVDRTSSRSFVTAVSVEFQRIQVSY